MEIKKTVMETYEENISVNSSKIEKLEILELGLIIYTFENHFNLIKELPKRKYIDLETTLKSVNKSLDDKDKQLFFNQYTDCVVRMIGYINNQNRFDTKDISTLIPIIKCELDTNVSILTRNDKIKAIITNEKLDDYKVAPVVIKEYKKILKK